MHQNDSTKSTFMNDMCRALVIWTLWNSRHVFFPCGWNTCGLQDVRNGSCPCHCHCLSNTVTFVLLVVGAFADGIFCVCASGPRLTSRTWPLTSVASVFSANTRTTLRRNTETKRSWSTVTAAQTSTGKNTKRKTRTKRRGERRRFVTRWSVCLLWKAVQVLVAYRLPRMPHNCSVSTGDLRSISYPLFCVHFSVTVQWTFFFVFSSWQHSYFVTFTLLTYGQPFMNSYYKYKFSLFKYCLKLWKWLRYILSKDKRR